MYSSKSFQSGCWRYYHGALGSLQGSLSGPAGVSLLSVYHVQHEGKRVDTEAERQTFLTALLASFSTVCPILGIYRISCTQITILHTFL